MHRAVLSAARRRAHLTASNHSARQCRRNFSTQQGQHEQPPPRSSAKSDRDDDNSMNSDDWRSHNQNTYPPPPGSPAHEVDQVSSLYSHNFAQPTLSSLDFFRRALKLSATLLALIAGTTLAAFEGAHMYVEHRALAPPPDADGELRKYGWDVEAERWTGGGASGGGGGGGGGGTDPGLGWKARHAVRSAWIAQNWGTGSQVLASGSIASAARAAGPIEAQLELAHDFLNIALAIALDRLSGASSVLHPETLTDLLQRHASTLERIGSKGALYDARSEYERVYAGLPSASPEPEETDARRARIALKCGNISARLGDDEQALEWWTRALALASGASANDVEGIKDDNASARPADRTITPSIPSRLPTSPLAQRTLAATLSALSAYYAQAGRLKDAKDVQERGLGLLKMAGETNVSSSVPPASGLTNPTTSSVAAPAAPTASPSKALHELFLLHRASLLSLHLAEVSYALHSSPSSSSSSTSTPTSSSLHQLTQTALLSERIAHLLTGSPLTHPDAPPKPGVRDRDAVHVPPPPAPEAQLDAAYAANGALRKPALSLLRDARRTAAQAWALSGAVLERSVKAVPSSSSSASGSSSSSSGFWAKSKKSKSNDLERKEKEDRMRMSEALACYERALGWAGVKADEQGGIGQPGEGTLESEWRALWRSYARVRDELKKDGHGRS